jgi:hypothetical protein
MSSYQPHVESKNPNLFIKKGIQTYNQIGSKVLKELCEDETNEIHRDHMYLLSKMNVMSFGKSLGKINPLRECLVKLEMRSTGTETLADLMSKTVPENGELHRLKSMIPERYKNKITTDEVNRDETAPGRLMDKIPIKLNIFRDTGKLKHREIFYCNTSNTDSPEPNPFIRMKKIKHPRERMSQFMSLHRKTYTNEKLHRLRMIESGSCYTCIGVTETLDHILFECPRSQQGWNVLKEFINEDVNNIVKINGPLSDKDINIFSLVKKTILTFRNEPINEELLRHRCRNRENDLNIVNFRNLQSKNLRTLKNDLFAKKVT